MDDERMNRNENNEEIRPTGMHEESLEQPAAENADNIKENEFAPDGSDMSYVKKEESSDEAEDAVHTAEEATPERKKKRRKKVVKPMTPARRWTTVVVSAVVFGLIAGGVMYGVNAGANRINTVSNIGTTETVADSSTASSGSDSTSGTVAQVAKNAMPSVVTISTMSVQEMQDFFGGVHQYESEGAGTGVIVGKNSTELLIATNNHVVEGADTLSVGFVDEGTASANIKGTDSEHDLAVIAVKLSDISSDTMNKIKIATIGDSSDLQLGEQVVAIGNALGYGQSVTSGYVSALDRELTLQDSSGATVTSSGLIQTDAAINPGNSGGALLNMQGELIGINEAKTSSTSNGTTVDNIGFAIPIDKAEESLKELMNQTTRTKVSDAQASYIGITGSTVSSDVSETYGIPQGVAVKSVVDNGPAAKAGMKQGDIITEFDGRSVSSMEQLQSTLEYYASGEQVKITVSRANNGTYKEQDLTITLGSAKDMPRQ